MKELIYSIGAKAKRASKILATRSEELKNALLESIASGLENSRDLLMRANSIDLEKGAAKGLSNAMLDRLALDNKRIDSMTRGVREVIALQDPVGEVLKKWKTEDHLQLSKVRVPIGVIGIIYESRPNVTVDAAVLCVKAGNAVVLRGGSEAFESNQALVRVMAEAARKQGLDENIFSFIPFTEREAIPLFCSMDAFVDLMIPRGGHGLIQTVVQNARMPVIKHYKGICHVYVHEKADFEMARKIIMNAKCQRPGVCNAAETLLVDRSIAASFLPECLGELEAAGVKILADESVENTMGRRFEHPVDWSQEYLDLILAVRVVDDISMAIAHIEEHGSHHSDTIVTDCESSAQKFLRLVDSAAVYWNVSTRFTDGGQFGFGAEIGISTDKIHARGPMALEELTSYKYIGVGSGLVRDNS